MILLWIAVASCLMALVPAMLFLRNLALYAPPPPRGQTRSRCSVLIPARDEEATIGGAVRSVLRNEAVDLEVIVLDDDSTDRTAQIVRTLACDDPRVRLETAPPLPRGWSGKQYACHVLADLAQHPLLVFMDADVRLKPDALARMSAFMERTGAALASGVPHQETQTFSEHLLIPLIHFVLLGFLPIKRMRASQNPIYGAGCGQLVIARCDAYRISGGHGAIRATLHDGPKLARAFRAAGFATDVFDATCIAECRMYATDAEVWRGLAKNAHEGLGSPRLIGPATLLLLGGQALPLCLLVAACLQRQAAPASHHICGPRDSCCISSALARGHPVPAIFRRSVAPSARRLRPARDPVVGILAFTLPTARRLERAHLRKRPPNSRIQDAKHRREEPNVLVVRSLPWESGSVAGHILMAISTRECLPQPTDKIAKLTLVVFYSRNRDIDKVFEEA